MDIESPIDFYEIPNLLPNEIFIPITIYKNTPVSWNYFISNYGRIYSSKVNRLLKPTKNSDNKKENEYLSVDLCSNCTNHSRNRIKALVERLVMETFCPIPYMEFFQVNHIDGNKENNIITNLEWNTRSQNILHAMKNGLNNTRAFCEDDVNIIRYLHSNGYSASEIWNNLYKGKASYATVRDLCSGKSYYTPENNSTKYITQDDVLKIRDLYNSGYNVSDIWNDYYHDIVSYASIKHICSNTSYHDSNYIPRSNKFTGKN